EIVLRCRVVELSEDEVPHLVSRLDLELWRTLERHANCLLDLRYVGGDTICVRALSPRASLPPASDSHQHQDDRETTSGHSVHATLFPDMRLTTRAISCPRTTIPCSINTRFNSDSTSDNEPLF